MKVNVVFPARDIVDTGFALDLGSLCANLIPGVSLKLNTCMGTVLPDQRSDLAQHAVDAGCDYLLWLDTDMRFPRDTLARLLAHKKPLVAANYTTRRLPINAVAKNYVAEIGEWRDVETKPDSKGLEEVSGVGMGVMLMSTDILKKMEKPWFTFPWDTIKKSHHGEDIHFCLLASKLGFPTFIDHDLSKEVRHIGRLEFCHEHVGAGV